MNQDIEMGESDESTTCKYSLCRKTSEDCDVLSQIPERDDIDTISKTNLNAEQLPSFQAFSSSPGLWAMKLQKVFTSIDSGVPATYYGRPDLMTTLNFFLKSKFEKGVQANEWDARGMHNPKRALRALLFFLEILGLASNISIIHGIKKGKMTATTEKTTGFLTSGTSASVYGTFPQSASNTETSYDDRESTPMDTSTTDELEPSDKQIMTHKKVRILLTSENILETIGFVEFAEGKRLRLFSSFVRNYLVGASASLTSKIEHDDDDAHFGFLDWIPISITHQMVPDETLFQQICNKSQPNENATSEVIFMDRWTAIAFSFLQHIPWEGVKTNFLYRPEVPFEIDLTEDKLEEKGESTSTLLPSIVWPPGPHSGTFRMQRVLEFEVSKIPVIVREIAQIVMNYVSFRQALYNVEAMDASLPEKLLGLHLTDDAKKACFANTSERQAETEKRRFGTSDTHTDQETTFYEKETKKSRITDQ